MRAKTVLRWIALVAVWLVALRGAGVAPAFSAPAAPVRMGPRPSWVVPVEVPDGSGSGGVDDAGAPTGSNQGVVELLLDQQVDLTRGVERYVRRVRRIVTRTGAETAGQVQIELEPSFQSAVLHGVWVVRDGQRIDALKVRSAAGQLRVVTKERAQDEQIYDGVVTAVWVVADLRVGDVLDVDYTISGDNPVFAGKFARDFVLGTGRGVERAHLLARAPVARPLRFRAFGPGAGEPAVREGPSGRELEWDLRRVASPSGEAHTPAWFPELPQVTLSELGTWQDVAAWAASVFEAPPLAAGPLLDRVVAIGAQNPDATSRALAALRVVQHDVRYLGIEMGENSHRPHPPEQVFAQRFGDCKDKTLLLVTMLRRLGIAADPVLVNTDLRAHLRAELPAPTAFDHVVVRLSVDGREVWVDPTRSEELGPLGEDPLRYGVGLVVGRETNDLSAIAETIGAEPLTRVVDTFRVSGSDATLESETTYRGRDASTMRDDLANVPRAKLEGHRRQLVAAVYPKAERVGSLAVTDDATKNVLVVRESYRLPEAASGALEVRATHIRSMLFSASQGHRTTPLELAYPAFVQQEVRIYGAPLQVPDPVTVETPAFAFQYSGEALPDSLVLFFDYRARRESVDAADAEQHAKRVAEVIDALSPTLEPVPQAPPVKAPPKMAPPPRWMFVPIGFVALVILAAIVGPPARRVLRRRAALRYGGETALEASLVRDRDDAIARVAARKCNCGVRPTPAQVTFSEVRLGEDVVDAGRATCGTCGVVNVRYFKVPKFPHDG
jgi:transglutaminase-like putative cysteine protease